MSVRAREWQSRDRKTGELITRRAFVCDYTDQDGSRRLKTFKTQAAARDWASKTHIEVKEGVHVPDSETETVAEACNKWLAEARDADLERTTVDQYVQHCELHIKPLIGRTLLSKINAPFVRALERKLRETPVTIQPKRGKARTYKRSAKMV